MQRLIDVATKKYRAIPIDHVIDEHTAVAPRMLWIVDYSAFGNMSISLAFVQQVPNSRVIEGTDSDTIGGIQRSQFQILSLAAALSRPVPNTNGGVTMNSPATGRRDPFDRDDLHQYRLNRFRCPEITVPSGSRY
ncbi:MAG TPA: hypothetical protein VE422_45710 [Terriglobia bacterium]|nr:hypothetical protein [Terriglobia bacterium]